jgi:hypothetical protein
VSIDNRVTPKRIHCAKAGIPHVNSPNLGPLGTGKSRLLNFPQTLDRSGTLLARSAGSRRYRLHRRSHRGEPGSRFEPREVTNRRAGSPGRRESGRPSRS